MLFINDIVQNINTNLDDIFTIDELQLFLLLYADDAEFLLNRQQFYN